MTVGKIENGLERGFVKHRLKLSFNNWPFMCQDFRVKPTEH